MSLFRLVDHLMSNQPLRHRFGNDPDGVMTEYRLSKREREILLTMDPAVVAPAVPPEMRPEVNAFMLPNGEFPPASDDFLAEGGGLDPQYPSPAPGIFRYRTNPPLIYVKDTSTNPATILRGFSADIVNTTGSGAIELSVFCQSFLDSDLQLVRKKPNDGAKAAIAEFYRLGTFRNTILRAVFNAPGPPGTTWTAGHQYEVIVINLNTTPHAATVTARPWLTVLT